MKKIKKFNELNEGFGNKSLIQKLENINKASVKDLVDGKELIWVMKKIILKQDERIEELEYKVAELRGEVEDEDYELVHDYIK